MPKESITACPKCSREFPADLIQELEQGTLGGPATFNTMCPLCARDIINAECGFPEGTPPPKTAPIARSMYMRAKKWMKR